MLSNKSYFEKTFMSKIKGLGTSAINMAKKISSWATLL